VYNQVWYTPEIFYGIKKESRVVNEDFMYPGRPLLDVLEKLIEQWIPRITDKVKRGIEVAIG
jgi:hypothetical protein